MVSISKFGDSAIKFTFDDSDHYLMGDGEITVPVNGLILVLDESDMATFKKIDGDPFISFNIANSNFSSKSDLETFYKDNMVGSTGGGGVTSGEVQTMIDESISGLAESSAVTEEISEAVSGKADTSAVTASINAAVSGKADTSDVQTLSGDVANKADTSAVTASINAAVSGKMDTSAFNTYSASTDARISEDEEVTSAALNELNEALSGKADTTAVTESINAAVSGKADTSAVTASITAAVSGKQDALVSGTNIKTINNESLLGSGNIDIQGGGKAIVAGTNISVTTGETADTVNCTLPISHNGEAISIGTSNLGSASRSVAIGDSNTLNAFAGNSLIGGQRSAINYNCGNSIAFGYETNVRSKYSFAFGTYTRTSNQNEFSTGRYNNSVSASTSFGNSGNTLFSVGNGTAENTRHNAFEIRQNGDIYITKDGSDIKLQDQLGGGGNNVIELTQAQYDALTDIDPTAFYIITDAQSLEARLAEDEEVTAAALNELDNKYSTIETTIGDINTILQSI